jgi:hypothetical protein
MGRFTSVDPLLSSGRIETPQTWNRYAFVLNNPLRYVDPLGLYEFAADATAEQKKRFREAFDKLKKVRDSLSEKSKDRQKLDKIITAYGEEGKGGPKIAFSADVASDHGQTAYTYRGAEGKNVEYAITVTFNDSSDIHVGLAAHEGQHVSDFKDALSATMLRNGLFRTPAGLNRSRFDREDRAYEIQQIVHRELGVGLTSSDGNRNFDLYKTSWEIIDGEVPSVRAQMLLSRWEYLREGQQYRLTPREPGDRIIRPRPRQ